MPYLKHPPYNFGKKIANGFDHVALEFVNSVSGTMAEQSGRALDKLVISANGGTARRGTLVSVRCQGNA